MSKHKKIEKAETEDSLEALDPEHHIGHPLQPIELDIKKSKKKRSLIGRLFKWFLILILIIVLAGVALYFLVKSGRLSALQLSQAIGPGNGELLIINTSESEVRVSLEPVDEESGSDLSDLNIESFGISGFGLVVAGEYNLMFSGAAATSGACNLEVKRGDEYQFVVVPEGIAVSEKDFNAQSGSDLLLESSPLCR